MDYDSPDERGMRFSPHRTNSHTSCCVPTCKSYHAKDPTVRFHLLPKLGSKVKVVNLFGQEESVERRSIWIKRLKLKKDLSDKAKVCSLHFVKDDYYFPDIHTKSRVLRKTAVPTVNLPFDESERSLRKKENAVKRAERTLNRSIKKEILTDPIAVKKRKTDDELTESLNEFVFINAGKVDGSKVNESSDSSYIENTTNGNSLSALKNIRIVDPASLIKKNNAVVLKTKVVADKSVQADIQTDLYKTFIKDENHLQILCGIPSFSVLNVLEDIVKVVTTNTLPKKSRLTIKDRIIMTFTKMKQNMDYPVLRVLFQVTSSVSCRKIFFRMVDILSTGLKFAVYWPDREEVFKNIPPSFADFPDVRAIVDVIEITAQKPEKLRSKTDPFNPQELTFKITFMTAVSPAGLITYISEPFMEKMSEKAVFEKTNFIEKLEAGDVIMTDKGFFIEDICSKVGVRVIKQPFFKKKNQLSAEKALLNEKIVKAREVMKKSYQRVRHFKVFSSMIPSGLLPIVEQMFFIVCAVINLSPSEKLTMFTNDSELIVDSDLLNDSEQPNDSELLDDFEQPENLETIEEFEPINEPEQSDNLEPSINSDPITNSQQTDNYVIIDNSNPVNNSVQTDDFYPSESIQFVPMNNAETIDNFQQIHYTQL